MYSLQELATARALFKERFRGFIQPFPRKCIKYIVTKTTTIHPLLSSVHHKAYVIVFSCHWALNDFLSWQLEGPILHSSLEKQVVGHIVRISCFTRRFITAPSRPRLHLYFFKCHSNIILPTMATSSLQNYTCSFNFCIWCYMSVSAYLFHLITLRGLCTGSNSEYSR
jgi:hypothetical protein